MRILLDADGVVAELQGAFVTWINDQLGTQLHKSDMRTHSSTVSPADAWGSPEDNERCRRIWGCDIRAMFDAFMKIDDVYRHHVHPIPGSQEAVAALRASGNEVLFVTSIGKFHESYKSKVEWLYDRFPGNRVSTISSDIKHYMSGDVFVDDRADTCLRAFYSGNITKTILFEQPWSYTDKLTAQNIQELEQTIARFRPNGWGTSLQTKRMDVSWAGLVEMIITP